MTENETIERCDLLINSLSVDNGVTNAFCDRSKGYVTFEKMREFTLNCKKALEEVQQYRQIGTVEECRAAVEKQTAEKPLGGMDADGNDYAICRECSAILSDGEWFAQYCPDCGKKVDWSDENEQRT